MNERLKDTPGSQLLSDIQTFLAGNQLYQSMNSKLTWEGDEVKKSIAISAINAEF